MSKDAWVKYENGKTTAYFKTPEAAKRTYTQIRSKWENIPLNEIVNGRFDMEIRTVIAALINLTGFDSIKRVSNQHLVPKAYIKYFGEQYGKNTIYLDVMNPLEIEKLFIEHSPILVANDKNMFYNDFLEHLLSKLEGNYSNAMRKIEAKKPISILDAFDIAVFLSTLQVRYPDSSLYMSEITNDKKKFSDLIIRRLMPNTIIYMICYRWTFFKADDESLTNSLATSLHPVVEAYIPINGSQQFIPNPLSPAESGHKMPAIVYSPLTHKIGLYLVSRQALNWIDKSGGLDDNSKYANLLINSKDQIIEDYNTIDYFINSGNISIFIDSRIKIESGYQSLIFMNPTQTPFKMLINNLNGAFKNQATKISCLNDASYSKQELDELVKNSKSSKPSGTKPAIQKTTIDISIEQRWLEIKEMSKKIKTHFHSNNQK